MSTYSVAAARSGNSTGDRTLRASAIVMPQIRISGAQTRKMRTSSQNARATSGNASPKVSASKNVARTRCHPSRRGTPSTIASTTTVVLAAAIMVPRRCWRRSYSARRERDGADTAAVSAPSRSVTGVTLVAVGQRLMTGASVKSAIHSWVIASSSPESVSAVRAWSTHSVSGLSFASRRPNSSVPLPSI